MNRYLVLTRRRPDFDVAVIAQHYAFLDALRANGQLELAGPFGDRSGGAYLLRADSLDAALAIIASDPVVSSGSSDVTVQEWHAK